MPSRRKRADVVDVGQPTLPDPALTTDRALDRSGRIQRRITPFSVFSVLLGLAITALVLIPLLRSASALVWIDGHPSFEAITKTIQYDGLATTLLDTLIVIVSSGTIAVIVGSVLAWLNERTDARMGMVTDVLPIVNLLVPAIAGAVGWLFLLSSRAGYVNGILRSLLGHVGIHLDSGPFNAYSWYAVIFVYALNMIPLVFLTVSAGLRSMDSALEEQARMSGAGVLRMLRTVTLPSVKPSIISASFLIVWYGLALFSVPVVLAQPAGIKILSVQIVQLLKFVYPPRESVALGMSVFVLIALVLVWLVQRRVIRRGRFAVLGGKGQNIARIELLRWRWPARMLILLYLFVAVVMPFAALVIVALNGFWSLDIQWGHLNLNSMRTVLTNNVTGDAIANSVKLGAMCAAVAVLVAAFVSINFSRSRSPLARFIDGAVKLPATVPSVVLAIGFVYAFAGDPLTLGGTILILFLAYLVLGMPEASISADAAFSRVNTELAEASQTSGAGPLRTIGRVYLPLMLPGLVVGWALVFVRVLGDTETAAVLSGTGNTVVGFQVLTTFQSSGYDELAALALTVVLVSTLAIAIVLLIARRLGRWGQRATGSTARSQRRPAQEVIHV